jgi:hypothetical protein
MGKGETEGQFYPGPFESNKNRNDFIDLKLQFTPTRK